MDSQTYLDLVHLSINGKVDEVVHTLVRVFGDVFRDEEIEK